MFERAWDLLVDGLIQIFMPLVCGYLSLTANPFLNMSDSQAMGIAKVADTFLVPVHYLFMGQEAQQEKDGSWSWRTRFEYKNRFWAKTVACALALPPSFALGYLTKGLSLLSQSHRTRFESLSDAWRNAKPQANLALYEQLGIYEPTSAFVSEQLPRKPGSETYLASAKTCLQNIAQLLNEAQIAWWVDCGTCLGAYRYGGVIPWDCDIDIAILNVDFENVRRVLMRLDQKKYSVQDWSSRDFPNTLFKVFVKETNAMIDIYNFAIDMDKQELKFILSLENNIFFPEWWKIRERRFKQPVAFQTVFPLKKAYFDGVEIFMPQDPKKYLQRYYGENLAPAKIYSADLDDYVKDLSHPYWKNSFVH